MSLFACPQQVRRQGSSAARSMSFAMDAQLGGDRQTNYPPSGPNEPSQQSVTAFGKAGGAWPDLPHAHAAGPKLQRKDVPEQPLMGAAMQLYGSAVPTMPEGRESDASYKSGHWESPPDLRSQLPDLQQGPQSAHGMPDDLLGLQMQLHAQQSGGLIPGTGGRMDPFSPTRYDDRALLNMGLVDAEQQQQQLMGGSWPLAQMSYAGGYQHMNMPGAGGVQPIGEVAKSNAPRLRRIARFVKTKKCKFWPIGTCNKGESCTFIHDEVPEVPDEALQMVQSRGAGASGSSSSQLLGSQIVHPLQMPLPGTPSGSQHRPQLSPSHIPPPPVHYPAGHPQPQDVNLGCQQQLQGLVRQQQQQQQQLLDAANYGSGGSGSSPLRAGMHWQL